jgi:EpsI family protein
MANARVIVVSILLALAAVISYCFTGKMVEVPITKPLSTFPPYIGTWKLTGTNTLTDDVSKMLGVDDYIYRSYVSSGGVPVTIYVSYFGRVGGGGKGYHSPKNCMPGSGWNVIHSEPLKLTISHSKLATIKINKMLMQKDAEKEIVFYWYQCRGRIIHSEYMEKIYLVLDSLLKQRSDGAFIRITAPIVSGQEAKTVECLKDFTRQVIPILREHLPGAEPLFIS